jgi:hypothetical protein
LIRGREVVYVGRSENILARIGCHVGSEIKFDSLFWIPVTGLDQFRLEQIYIAKLRPKHNTQHVPNGTKQNNGTTDNNHNR